MRKTWHMQFSTSLTVALLLQLFIRLMAISTVRFASNMCVSVWHTDHGMRIAMKAEKSFFFLFIVWKYKYVRLFRFIHPSIHRTSIKNLHTHTHMNNTRLQRPLYWVCRCAHIRSHGVYNSLIVETCGAFCLQKSILGTHKVSTIDTHTHTDIGREQNNRKATTKAMQGK